ncbi:MAG: condensation domain-containing protein, partial [Pyrinomonadaceae bacterium]
MTPEREAVSGFRLSPQQAHLWALGPEARNASMQCALLIEGALDVPVLDAALRRLVERHEIFRTTLGYLPGMSMPLQIVAESSDARLLRADPDLSSDGGREEMIERLSREAAREPFDLATGPTLRAMLGTLSARAHVLV